MTTQGALLYWIAGGPFILLRFAFRYPIAFVGSLVVAMAGGFQLARMMYSTGWKKTLCFFIGCYIVLLLEWIIATGLYKL